MGFEDATLRAVAVDFCSTLFSFDSFGSFTFSAFSGLSCFCSLCSFCFFCCVASFLSVCSFCCFCSFASFSPVFVFSSFCSLSFGPFGSSSCLSCSFMRFSISAAAAAAAFALEFLSSAAGWLVASGFFGEVAVSARASLSNRRISSSNVWSVCCGAPLWFGCMVCIGCITGCCITGCCMDCWLC